MNYYLSLEPNDLVPVKRDLAKAIRMFAPNLAHVSQARVVCLKRTAVLSVQDEVAVKVNAPRKEAVNLKHVWKHASLPVPKLFGLYRGEDERLNFAVMEFVKGKSGEVVWPSLSAEQKQHITGQLKVCFEELRSFSASYIGTVDFDALLSDHLEYSHSGPFRDEDELNDALVKSLGREPNYYAPFLREILKSGHKIVLSHGDFGRRNLLIHEGELSGIVDWEYAGFYPEYWDYAVACDDFLWAKPGYADWNECVQQFLKPCPVEAATLRIMLNFSVLGH